MLTVRVLLIVAAFVCAVASLATPRVHPAVAPLLLAVLELLQLLPL